MKLLSRAALLFALTAPSFAHADARVHSEWDDPKPPTELGLPAHSKPPRARPIKASSRPAPSGEKVSIR